MTSYTYEPLPDEPAAALGSLYVVVEVLVSGRASEEVADLVIGTMGDEYYNQATSPGVLGRFEAAIKATNHELGEYVNRGNAAWIGKLSAVVAVQCEDELHVAHTGSAEAYLYRGKSATNISGGNSGRPTSPTKTFGSLASGKLESGDRLLLATPALVHQVPLSRLQSIISQSSPNTAIAEITDLLRGASIDRIAAVIVEMTTPELAALQVRSEQPDEIRLGSPESALDAARMAATPLAQTTLKSSQKVASVAKAGWARALPVAERGVRQLAGGLQKLLSTKGGIRNAAVGGVAVALILLAILSYQRSSAQTAKVLDSYRAAYTEFTQAQEMLDSGSRTQARDTFADVQHQLAGLKAHQRLIDTQAKGPLAQGQPRTFAAFATLVAERLDQIDGLVKVNPTTVANFTTRKARPEHFELYADKAYVIDTGNHNAISVVNVLTGATKPSAADASKVGVVVDTTLSGNNDGFFILTDKPGVWFYRFDTDALTEQTISFGEWPSAKAIASYASNIYLLGETAIYKHTKNAAGYSPRSEYIRLSSEETKTPQALAIDGSIYLATGRGLHRFLGNKLTQSAPVPETLPAITHLRSTAGGKVLVGTSAGTDRIGVWSARGTDLAFDHQIALGNIKALYNATYDAKSKTVYALVDSRLVRFQLEL